MDFKEISDFFNGTIFPEEYRVNLQDAESRICQLELNISFSSTTQDRATILMLRALHATMIGNLSQSEDYLASFSILAEESGDQSLICRCRTLQQYTLSLKKLPPFLKFRSDADTYSGQISNATLDIIGKRGRNNDLQSSHYWSWSGIERLESEVVSSISDIPFKFWTVAFHHHPNYRNHNCAMIFDSSLPCETRFIDNAKDLGLLQTSRYMKRLNVEYLLAGASTEGEVERMRLFLQYLEDNDLIGVANSMIIQADAKASLPFTSPIALNLYTEDFEFGIEPLRILGRSEQPELPLVKDETAVSIYKAAYTIFETVNSDRGKAAVCLRLACLDFAEYIESISTGDATLTSRLRPEDIRNSVQLELDKALNWFQGDGTNTQIVAGYQVLLNIILGEGQMDEKSRETLSGAAQIGAWGKENGNSVVSQFVGMLMACVGRKLSKTPRNLTMASHCFACARACFHTLEDHTLELHAIVCQAQLQKQHGNLELAKTYMETGQEILELAVTELEGLLGKVSLDSYPTLKATKNGLVTNFGRAALSIYQNDAIREEKWKKQQDYHLKESGVVALVRSLPANIFTGADSAVPTAADGPISPDDAPSGSLQDILAALLSASPGTNIMDAFTSFVSRGMGSIDDIQTRFKKAVEGRRMALVHNTDVDEADNYMREFISSLGGTESIPSAIGYVNEGVALQYLGDFETARRVLPRAIPDIFGGALNISIHNEDDDHDLSDMQLAIIAQQRQNHANRSISMCFIAKDWALGAQVLRGIRKVLPEFFEKAKTAGEGADWYLMTWIASIEYHSGNFESAFDWNLRALEVIEKARSKLADDNDRREIFSSIHSAELFISLARTALKFSELENSKRFDEIQDIWKFRGPTWRDEAILFLEQGRARVLLDLLIPEVVPEEFLRWKDWSHQLRVNELRAFAERRAETSQEQIQAWISSAKEDLEKKAAESKPSDPPVEDLQTWIANVKRDLEMEKGAPSLAFIVNETHFAADVAKLYHSIPPNAIVVHVNASRDGLLIICIGNSGIEFIHSSDMTDGEMQRHVLHYLKPLKDVEKQGIPSGEKYEVMTNAIALLSDEIIKPISSVIANRSHIIFVPSRSLNKFPVSALLLDGKPIVLEKTISTVPSLSVLHHLVERDGKRTRPERKDRKAAVVFRAPLKKDSKAALNLSAAAAIEISQLLGCQPQSTHEIGVEEFGNSYQQSDIMLIATHGTDSQESAWKASLSLKTEFEVLDLVKLQGKAALVVFEACLSGLGEESVGNDILGFSYSILSSGASSFIGCLWAVSDLASAYLMSFLFVELLKTGSGSDLSFASCLRQAQKHLYEADASEIISVLRRFKTVCETVDTESKNKILSKTQQRKILDALDYTIEGEEEQSGTGGLTYAHPFYWAAFVLVGCGSLSL